MDSILDALFPESGQKNIIARMRAGTYLHETARLAQLSALTDITANLDPLELVRLHVGRVRLHLVNNSGRYRADVTVASSQASAFLDNGVSVNIDGLEASNPHVSLCVDLLAQELNIPRQCIFCSAFISPAGSGVPLHFDDKDVIVVQLQGRKKWELAPNTEVCFPGSNSSGTGRHQLGLDGGRRPVIVEMLPGSSLFVPRAHWHGTTAVETSVSLSFGLAIPSWQAVFLERIRLALTAEEHWRAPAVQLGDEGAQYLPLPMQVAMDRAIRQVILDELGSAVATEVRSSYEMRVKPALNEREERSHAG